jgi:hypothetical protein
MLRKLNNGEDMQGLFRMTAFFEVGNYNYSDLWEGDFLLDIVVGNNNVF